MINYCLYKGKLRYAAPYKDSYEGYPHYVITVGDDPSFNIVVNSASQVQARGDDTRVLFYADPNFDDLITSKLQDLPEGLHTSGFPRLDYWPHKSLLDLKRFRVVPYQDQDGKRFDVNDMISGLLTIDINDTPESRAYDNGRTVQNRDFWSPQSPADVIVYGFGFLFPKRDGLHETHMNQGNPRSGGHGGENGAFHDGAVIIQIGANFSAIFTAFQSQYVPTDARGYPVEGAKSLPDYINAL